MKHRDVVDSSSGGGATASVRRTWLSTLIAVAMTVVTLALPTAPASASAPGRDGKVVFVRANQIYTINAGGTGLVKLTSTGKNYRPKWSPTGTRLSYVHETATGREDLWVMNANGTGKQQVTRVGTVTTAGSWSPNGASLAFAASIGTDDWGLPAQPALHTVKATSPFGSPRPLLGHYTGCDWGCDDETPGPITVDRHLAWSTDGATIALYNHHDGYFDNALYMYSVATGEARQVGATGADCCGYGTWRDLFWGPTNVFGSTSQYLGEYGDEPEPSRIGYGSFVSAAGDTGGAPSPSGRYMAFTNASSGVAKVHIADSNGSGRRFLTNGYQPDWQPLR